MKTALIIGIILASLHLLNQLRGKEKILDFLSIYYIVLFSLCLKAF